MNVAHSKSDYAKAAKDNGLLIAEHDGTCMGIGTRDELEGLIAAEVLPRGTVLREARQGDF
jgi:hypothetical protein